MTNTTNAETSAVVKSLPFGDGLLQVSKLLEHANKLETERNALRSENERLNRKGEGTYNLPPLAVLQRDELARLSSEVMRLNSENEKLKEERENWRVSSVCRELSAENDKLKERIAYFKDISEGYWKDLDACKEQLEKWKSVADGLYNIIERIGLDSWYTHDEKDVLSSYEKINKESES